MDSVLKSVLEEELQRNLLKQHVFNEEIIKYPKGSLNVIVIHGDKYLYRKCRVGNKVISKYIGPVNSEVARKAYLQRDKYLQLKHDLKYLKQDEFRLRKMIKLYK